MIKSFFIILLLLTVSNSHSQTDNANNFKFKLSLSKGLSFNTDHNIFEKGKTLDASLSRFNVDLTNLEFGYYISKSHELGVSFGKNSFTIPDNFVAVMKYENTDTIFFYSPGYKYVNMTWIALYYNFHFENTYKVGVKFGQLKPNFLENNFKNYLSLSVGKYYRVTNNFLIDATINFTNRNRSFKYFKSNQLNLSLGFNLKI